MFSIRVTTTGQADITTDVQALYAVIGDHAMYGSVHMHYQNDGFWLSSMVDRKVTAAAIRAAFPAARVRIIKSGVRVRFPVAMMERVARLEADWQTWAAQGLSHREMQRRAINHPEYLAA